MSYNGWTNRQTWLVPLHIDNDYDCYKATRKVMIRLYHITPDNRLEAEIVNLLRKMVWEELMPPMFYDDLKPDDESDWEPEVNYINFWEIAENYVTDLVDEFGSEEK